MLTYPLSMVPGPVSVPEQIRKVYQVNYGSGDLEPEFFDLYAETETNLKTIMGTKHSVVIQTGEAMLVLWGALKSCLLSKDRVLAIGTGIFGRGIGEMASSLGANVKAVNWNDNETIGDLGRVEKAIQTFKPKMITAVHCETPSGTLNPLSELGKLKKNYHVPLFYVDAVSSVGGAPIETDKNHIDLCLGGSQKCLSAPPSSCFLSVSDTAWDIIEQVDYAGYDALEPFRKVQKEKFFPYTPDWYGVAALNTAAKHILDEGLDKCFDRHQHAAAFCRQELISMGFALFPAADAVPSPTVTAVNIPLGWSWKEFDNFLRKNGLVVGGSLGPMEGKVFRLGHMGSQADMPLVKASLEIIKRRFG
ncbi:MAG: aminotransferase class V-fold PLP-dependent enzyme [Desulfobacterales bacterium]